MAQDSVKAIETQESRDESRIRELLPLLLNSRWAAWTFVAFAVFLGLGSLGLFCYQIQARTDVFGNLYREEAGSWVHLFGHLVRAFASGWLMLRVLRYLRQVQQLQTREVVELGPLFIAISRGIAAIGWCCLILLCYGLTVLIDVKYGLPSISLGSRPSPLRFSQTEVPPANIALYEARFTEAEGWIKSSYSLTQSQQEPVYLNKVPIVVTEDIVEARPAVDQQGHPALTLRLSEEGSRKLAAATAKLINKPLAIVIDDVVLSVPIIRSPLSGSVMITGEMTDERVRQIADSINQSWAKE